MRERIEQAQSRGAVVLTQVLAGGGGVGKSQLAAAYARQADEERVDLRVWVNATDPAQIPDAYARTAHRLQLPGTGQDADADAKVFLEWLAETDRSWLIILDDITDLEAMSPWWPPTTHGGRGRVLATTRRRDAALSGAGRTLIDIGTYTPEEAHTYLTQRLNQDQAGHLLDDQTHTLAQDLGHLPLALAYAAAYMINEHIPCRAYRERLAERGTRLDHLMAAAGDGYPHPQITAALLLTLDAVKAHDPTGLAIPALRMAAYLDPAGHPQALWATTPARTYLTTHHTSTNPLQTPPPPPQDSPFPRLVTENDVQRALRVLHRYSLVTHQPHAGHRAVRVHALTARATRDTTPPTLQATAARTAADALLEIWPQEHHTDPDLVTVLRANAETLTTHAQPHLWNPQGHRVLYRSGTSLLDAGLTPPAIEYWTHLQQTAHNHLGPHHPDTLTARNNLALSYRQAGRTEEAIALQEQVLADSERVLGTEHPDTLTARGNLATSYQQAGRTEEAIALQEQVLADIKHAFGTEHPDTLRARGNLATSYWQAGRTEEAIALEEQVLTGIKHAFGTEHPDTLRARGNLATSYWQAGRTEEAIALEEQVLTDRERVLGTEHPDTLLARGNLATSYQQAGRTEEAIALLEQVLADIERVLGTDHPDTLLARGNLATSYQQAGRTEEAIALLEQVLADRERVLGTHHPDTLRARGNLATSYQQAGRTEEAIALEEQVLTDIERVLGTDHPDTLLARGNLATSYQQAGRTEEAIALLEQVLADRERVLGAEHPDAEATRAVLARWLGGEGDVRVVETG